jgi:hypothetical protein
LSLKKPSFAGGAVMPRVCCTQRGFAILARLRQSAAR